MASVPYEYECDKNGGFLPDPNEHKRVGYITHLEGFSQTAIVFDANLNVFTPWNNPNLTINATFTGKNATGPTASATNGLQSMKVVGVIEKLAWNGGAGDFIAIDFWTSQENAIQLKTAQQSTLTTTRVNALNWWVINYDQEKKVWYEQSWPVGGPVTGIIGPQDNPELNVDLSGAPAKDGIDVMVYKVSMQVAPGANLQYTLNFSNAAATTNSKSWGLVVGSWAAAAY